VFLDSLTLSKQDSRDFEIFKGIIFPLFLRVLLIMEIFMGSKEKLYG